MLAGCWIFLKSQEIVCHFSDYDVVFTLSTWFVQHTEGRAKRNRTDHKCGGICGETAEIDGDLTGITLTGFRHLRQCLFRDTK